MTTSNLAILSGASLFTDTSNGATAVNVKASSTVVYGLELDNTANAAATYLRIYNTTSPTVGTTVPDWIIMVPASVSRTITIVAGLTFGTGLSISSGTSAALATTTAPSSAFAVKITYV